MGCEVLITQDEAWRRGSTVPLKKTADEAMAAAPGVKSCIVLRRTGGDVPMTEGRDHWWHELADRRDARARASRWTPRTCSTSSTPRARPRSRRGSPTRPAATSSASRRRTTTSSTSSRTRSTGAPPTSAGSPGTATSSTGPLCNGTTGVIYEGTPDFPDQDRWWEIVERYKADILYTAPTAIRTHMKWGPEYAQAARPLEPAAARLGRRADQPGGLGLVPRAHRRRPLPDRRHLVADRDRDDPDHAAAGDHDDEARLGDPAVPRASRPRSTTRPARRSGRAAAATSCSSSRGRRCCAGIYGDDARYRETYWSKYGDVYFAGDGARIDADGDFWLLGRVDDVMNVSGHRISTIEVESALVDHHDVAEAAVAARNDAMTGQAIVAFVTLKGGAEGSVEKLEELRNHVAEKIGPIAKPANIVFTPELPKTRSGKIMRRLLRDVAENRPLGDTTTLADPAVVSELQTRAVEESSDEG